MISALRLLVSEGFRVFFLAAAVFAVLSIAVWLRLLTGGQGAPFAPPPHLWHGHEMIFGYACAVLGGFFLTAAPNWTGGPAAKSAYISAVAAVWLAGRLAVWWSGALPAELTAAIDLAFLPMLGAKLAVLLMRKPQPRNLMLLGLLSIVWLGNLMTHLEWIGAISDGVLPGLRVGLFGVAAMIAVIGGRVTPAFTRNALRRDGAAEDALPVSRRPAEIAGIGSAIALPLTIAAGAPDVAVGAVAMAAGLAQAARLAGWSGGRTLGQPILWSLHLAAGMLALGYLLYGAALLGALDEIAALHVVGIGAVGGMTVAVMSRAILGHTGRALIAPRPVAAAYGLIALAAAARYAGTWADAEAYSAAMTVSGALWILAFGLFLAALGPALIRPRPPRSESAAA